MTAPISITGITTMDICTASTLTAGTGSAYATLPVRQWHFTKDFCIFLQRAEFTEFQLQAGRSKPQN